MESEMRNLVNSVVIGKSLEMKRKMEDVGSDKAETEENKKIDDILGHSANSMTGEEREVFVRRHMGDSSGI